MAVNGKFSSTQRDIYDVVLAAHDACIAQVRPGVEYQDLHLLACTAIAQGLVDLGILRGDAENLVERNAHSLFFLTVLVICWVWMSMIWKTWGI